MHHHLSDGLTSFPSLNRNPTFAPFATWNIPSTATLGQAPQMILYPASRNVCSVSFFTNERVLDVHCIVEEYVHGKFQGPAFSRFRQSLRPLTRRIHLDSMGRYRQGPRAQALTPPRTRWFHLPPPVGGPPVPVSKVEVLFRFCDLVDGPVSRTTHRKAVHEVQCVFSLRLERGFRYACVRFLKKPDSAKKTISPTLRGVPILRAPFLLYSGFYGSYRGGGVLFDVPESEPSVSEEEQKAIDMYWDLFRAGKEPDVDPEPIPSNPIRLDWQRICFSCSIDMDEIAEAVPVVPDVSVGSSSPRVGASVEALFSKLIEERRNLRDESDYVARAQQMLKERKYHDAMADCTLALEKNSKCVDAFEIRAEANRRRGNLQDAMCDLTSAISMISRAFSERLADLHFARCRVKWEGCFDENALVDFGEFCRLRADPSLAKTSPILALLEGYLIDMSKLRQTEELLGEGATSRVKKGFFVLNGEDQEEEDQKEIAVAVKTFSVVDWRVRRCFVHEVELLVELRKHPHIVFCHGCHVDLPEGQKLSATALLVLEECHKEHLSDWALDPSHTIHERLLVLRQIVLGIQFLHRNGVVHRDIKPNNILLGLDGNWKLADFGYSRHVESWSFDRAKGTVCYMAPPPVDSRNKGPCYDMYSLGVVAWELLTGELSYEDLRREFLEDKTRPDAQGMFFVICGKGLRPEWHPVRHAEIPRVLRQMVVRCWQWEGALRPSIGEFLEMLDGVLAG